MVYHSMWNYAKVKVLIYILSSGFIFSRVVILLVCLYLDTFDFPFGLSVLYTQGRLFSQWLLLVVYIGDVAFYTFLVFWFHSRLKIKTASPGCNIHTVLSWSYLSFCRRNVLCRCFLAVSCALISVVLRFCVYSPTFKGSNVSLDPLTSNPAGILVSLPNITRSYPGTLLDAGPISCRYGRFSSHSGVSSLMNDFIIWIIVLLNISVNLLHFGFLGVLRVFIISSRWQTSWNISDSKHMPWSVWIDKGHPIRIKAGVSKQMH